MNKFGLYYSFISIVLFLSASIVFFFVYHSVEGGLWAVLAAWTAAICFRLHKLYFDQRLQNHFTVKVLDYILIYGVTTSLIGSIFSVWYIFSIIYWKLPLMDYKKPIIFPCVFSFLNGKWGYYLYRASKDSINEILRSNYSPLIQHV